MTYLLIILGTILLFAGFLSVTAFETHRGTRLFAGPRAEFDANVARATFVLRHVDWSAFLGHLTRQGIERALHDAAHTSLMLVRMLERSLTRAVRTMRTRRLAELGANEPIDGALPLAIAVSDSAQKQNPAIAYLKTTLRKTRRKPRQMDITSTKVTEQD